MVACSGVAVVKLLAGPNGPGAGALRSAEEDLSVGCSMMLVLNFELGFFLCAGRSDCLSHTKGEFTMAENFGEGQITKDQRRSFDPYLFQWTAETKEKSPCRASIPARRS